MADCFSAAITDSRCSCSTQSFFPGAVFSPHMTHLDRAFAPAERKADIGLFLPAKVLRIGARTVAEKMLGKSFAGIKSLDIKLVKWEVL
jgi:hypothetical protein